MRVVDEHGGKIAEHFRQPVGWNLFAPEQHVRLLLIVFFVRRKRQKFRLRISLNNAERVSVG
jgi:hypothetical protein